MFANGNDGIEQTFSTIVSVGSAFRNTAEVFSVAGCRRCRTEILGPTLDAVYQPIPQRFTGSSGKSGLYLSDECFVNGME